MMRIFRIDEENIDNIVHFEAEFGEYKNIYGRISPYEFICQDYKLYQLLNNDKNIIKSFIINKIDLIQTTAKKLNILSSLYDYLNEDRINELINTIDNANNNIDIIDYLYQACFINFNKSAIVRKRKKIY